MGFFNGLRKYTSKVIDLRVDRWVGLGEIKHNTLNLTSYIKKSFSSPKPTHAESFTQAMQRLNLTEQDIKNKQKEFKILFIIFAALSFAVFAYAVYMAIEKYFMASLISISLTAYMAAMAFRYHFWLFQLKKRKLGCTVKEWLDAKI